MADHVKDKRCKLAAGNLAELRQLLTLDVVSDFLGIPNRLRVVMTGLPIDAETPSVKVAIVGESGSVAEASRARFNLNDLAVIVGWESDALG